MDEWRTWNFLFGIIMMIVNLVYTPFRKLFKLKKPYSGSSCVTCLQYYLFNVKRFPEGADGKPVSENPQIYYHALGSKQIEDTFIMDYSKNPQWFL